MGQMSTMFGCIFDIADGAFVCCLLAKVSMRSSLDISPHLERHVEPSGRRWLLRTSTRAARDNGGQ